MGMDARIVRIKRFCLGIMTFLHGFRRWQRNGITEKTRNCVLKNAFPRRTGKSGGYVEGGMNGRLLYRTGHFIVVAALIVPGREQ
jgi:hypothetical protein